MTSQFRPQRPQRPRPGTSVSPPATFSRRTFLAAGLSGIGALATRSSTGQCGESAPTPPAAADDLPRLDLHVHLDNSTIDKVLELSQERGVKFGIVEHAGTEENKYPVVLSNDEELGRYLAMLDGKPVYRGVQTEWHDWVGCFSREMLGRLDYILTDAMTFPGRDGQRVKLWEKDVESRVDMADKQAFMDRYVDWYVAIIEQQPIDILANVSWLPAPLAVGLRHVLDSRARPACGRHGRAARRGPGDQLRLPTAQTQLPGSRQGGGRQVLVRHQRTLSEHGQARLLVGHGPRVGADANRPVHACAGGAESRSAPASVTSRSPTSSRVVAFA